jgi:hypothetical protein
MSQQLSPIDSSMFSGHHYDPSSRAMTLRYKNGAVWHYDGVSPDKNAAFLGSASKGQYFNAHIKNAHPGRRG